MQERRRLSPVSCGAVHVCVDMQRMFAESTEWHTPWMNKVRPVIARIARHMADRTIFTRFIPARRPGDATGMWRRYYERWSSMTIERLGTEPIELLPELAELVPPAEIIDKPVYSPWLAPGFERRLREREAETLIVTGAETDVCVLATVLGAVDRGYRILVVTDAMCSSADETHDAILRIYSSRYGQQIAPVTSAELLGE